MATLKDKIKAEMAEHVKILLDVTNDNEAEKVKDRKIELIGNEKDLGTLLALEGKLNLKLKMAIILAFTLIMATEGVSMPDLIKMAHVHMEKEDGRVSS